MWYLRGMRVTQKVVWVKPAPTGITSSTTTSSWSSLCRCRVRDLPAVTSSWWSSNPWTDVWMVPWDPIFSPFFLKHISFKKLKMKRGGIARPGWGLDKVEFSLTYSVHPFMFKILNRLTDQGIVYLIETLTVQHSKERWTEASGWSYWLWTDAYRLTNVYRGTEASQCLELILAIL